MKEKFVGIFSNKENDDDYPTLLRHDTSFTDTMNITWLDTNHLQGRLHISTIFHKLPDRTSSYIGSEFLDFSTKVDTPFIYWTQFATPAYGANGLLYFTNNGDSIHFSHGFSDSHGYRTRNLNFAGKKLL